MSSEDEEPLDLSVPTGRSSTRESVMLQAVIRHQGSGEDRTVRVRNLSEGGMMADCDHIFASGDAVEVELRGIGLILGKIVWRTPKRIGVAFVHPVNPRLVRMPPGWKPGR